jgi:hypothetical protein
MCRSDPLKGSAHKQQTHLNHVAVLISALVRKTTPLQEGDTNYCARAGILPQLHTAS